MDDVVVPVIIMIITKKPVSKGTGRKIIGREEN